MTTETVLTAVVSAIGSPLLLRVVRGIFDRNKTTAETHKTEAETDSIHVQAAAKVIELLNFRMDQMQAELVAIRAQNFDQQARLEECDRDRKVLHGQVSALQHEVRTLKESTR